MNRRRFLQSLTAAGVLAAGIGATSCSTGTGSAPGTAVGHLTIGLTYSPDIQFAPFYVAEQKGYFAQAHLAVTLRHHDANESLSEAIQGGQEQVIYAGATEMVQARSQGVPLVNFATHYESFPVALIVPSDSPIRTAADLKGRSVGVPGAFGETWFGLRSLLSEAGLAETDVDIRHIGFTQQAALTARQVDAVMGYANNDAVRLQAAGVPVRTIPVAEGTVPLPGIGLGAPEAVMLARTNDLTTLHEALLRAIGDIVADPEEAITLSASHVPGIAAQRETALAVLKATIPLYGPRPDWGKQSPESWAATSTFLQDLDLLGSPVPPTEAYTPAIAGTR